MISKILTLAYKDWLLYWADRRAALLCFVVPILLASAFGKIFERPLNSSSAVKLPLLVVCESDDPAVRAFVGDILNSPRLEGRCVSRPESERMVADRRPGIAVILPANFRMPGLATERPNLEILHHPLNANECGWAEGALLETMMKRTFGSVIEPPFRVQTQTMHGTNFSSYSHSFCGMTLQYLLFWGMESGLLFLRERQRGTWRRIRSMPVPFAAILIGKALATAFVALLQVFVTFLFGYLAFGVQVSGSITGFVLLALSLSFLAAATGLLVAALGGTEARARSVCILSILGGSMLGGLWLPAFLLPDWARDIAIALPTNWAMNGLDGVISQGRGFTEALTNAVIVAGFSLVFLIVAAFRLSIGELRRRKGHGDL